MKAVEDNEGGKESPDEPVGQDGAGEVKHLAAYFYACRDWGMQSLNLLGIDGFFVQGTNLK